MLQSRKHVLHLHDFILYTGHSELACLTVYQPKVGRQDAESRKKQMLKSDQRVIKPNSIKSYHYAKLTKYSNHCPC